MLSWIIQNTIISIIIIFLVHYLFNFFKTTLTVPKIKDLVNTPNKKYENMFNVISKKNTDNNNSYSDNNSYTDIDLLPNLDSSDTDTITNINTSINSKNMNSDSMKNELKSFLKKQLKETNSSIEPSSSINNFATNSNTYSEY